MEDLILQAAPLLCRAAMLDWNELAQKHSALNPKNDSRSARWVGMMGHSTPHEPQFTVGCGLQVLLVGARLLHSKIAVYHRRCLPSRSLTVLDLESCVSDSGRYAYALVHVKLRVLGMFSLTAAQGRALKRSKSQKQPAGLNAEQPVGPVHGTIGKASLDGPLFLVNGTTRPFSPAPERRLCMPTRASVFWCMLFELARRGEIESSASLRHGGPISQSRSARYHQICIPCICDLSDLALYFIPLRCSSRGMGPSTRPKAVFPHCLFPLSQNMLLPCSCRSRERT